MIKREDPANQKIKLINYTKKILTFLLRFAPRHLEEIIINIAWSILMDGGSYLTKGVDVVEQGLSLLPCQSDMLPYHV